MYCAFWIFFSLQCYLSSESKSDIKIIYGEEIANIAYYYLFFFKKMSFFEWKTLYYERQTMYVLTVVCKETMSQFLYPVKNTRCFFETHLECKILTTMKIFYQNFPITIFCVWVCMCVKYYGITEITESSEIHFNLSNCIVSTFYCYWYYAVKTFCVTSLHKVDGNIAVFIQWSTLTDTTGISLH